MTLTILGGLIDESVFKFPVWLLDGKIKRSLIEENKRVR